jgi:hypothetical protein
MELVQCIGKSEITVSVRFRFTVSWITFGKNLILMKAHATLGSLILSVCLISSCSQENYHLDPGFMLRGYKTLFDSSVEYYHFYDRDDNGTVYAERDSTKNQEMITDLAYDNMGKLTKASFRQNGSTVNYTYDFEYNSLGKISKRQRRSGALTVNEDYNIYTYDEAGRLVSDSQFSKGSGTTYQLAWVSKFTYDGVNVAESQSYQVVNGTPQLYARLKNEYDNKMNPFRSQINEYYLNEGGNAIYAITITCLNNVVKQYAANGNGDYQPFLNSSYVYNANSYAWKVRSVNVTQPHQNSDVEYYYE